MTIISPSLLSCNFLELQKELDAFKICSDLWFHLDIMDSHLVSFVIDYNNGVLLPFGKRIRLQTVVQGLERRTKKCLGT